MLSLATLLCKISLNTDNIFYTMGQERRGYNVDTLIFVMILMMNSQTCTAIRTFVTEK